MARAIFTSQTPGFPDESDGAPGLTLGTVFSCSADTDCNGIWWYFPATTPGATVLARLYDEDSQALIASASFSASPTGGAWNLATFAAPVTLTAGNNYVAAIWTPDRYVATGNLFGSAITNGDFTAPADDPGGVRNGRFNSGGTPAYPSNTFGANGYLVDVDINASETITGVATANLGGLTAAAAGTRTVNATAAASLGGLTATAAGTRKTPGTATASLGPLTATAAGARTVTAQALASLGTLTATATGQRTVYGVVTASLGALTATASGTNGAQRDLDITLGRPEPKWRVGRPAPKWHVGRPEV
jgi:hypothetical protein